MRLAKRRLAFLLSCSLMFNSLPAKAGLMEQELVDRVEFLQYAGLFLWMSVSSHLRNYILGNGPKPDDPAELEKISNLWDENQVEFTVSQTTTFFALIHVYNADGVEFALKPEELQEIAEIAPGLASIIAASYHHEVHLPISGTMLILLVKIVRGENTDDTILDLLNGEREELEQLVEEVENLKCKKIIELFQEATQTLRQKIAKIAPGLATSMEPDGPEINTLVSEVMTSLLVKVARGENCDDTMAGLSTSEREELIEEAKRIKCQKIVSMLQDTTERTSTSARTTPTSSPRSKRTNHNGHIDTSHEAENPQPPTRERSHSVTGLASDLGKALRTKSRERRPRKVVPVETELVHVTENLIPSDATPLEQLFHFASSKRDNSLLCHYYPLVISDDELRSALKDYRENCAHFNFAQALITCFEEQGFPNGPPSTALLDLFRYILEKSFEARLGGQLDLSKQNSLSHVSVTIEDLDSIFTPKYTDKEVAAAWTQCNVNLFRNLKPIDLESTTESSFTLLSGAFNNTVAWIVDLIAKQSCDEARLALLKRLLAVSGYMLKVNDFHGAFTIHLAFQAAKNAYPILQNGGREKAARELMNVFAQSEEYKLCREKLTELRSRDGTTFLKPAKFYLDAYARTKTNAEAMNPSDKIMALGTFLQKVHKDKSRAPRVENVNLKLLNLFMNLPHLKEKK